MMLPIRDGLNPTRIVLPHDGASRAQFATAYSYLVHRFPDDVDRLAAKVAAGEVVDGAGHPITAQSPYVPRGFLFLYRDVLDEPEVPFEVRVLYRDANIVVVDKPHFLATTPRGAYVTRSVVVRLRKELGIDTLSPAHRLDRVTAGVLLLTIRPEARGAYQGLFERREVRKVYEAVAPLRVDLDLPIVVRSRIVKERGIRAAREVPGPDNAESRIDLLDTDAERGLGRYRLEPHTGRTHQLRLHMARLGVPIRHDNFYPVPYDVDPQDYSAPLQLVARSIEFTDPLTGRPQRFSTDRCLTEWDPRAGEGR